MLRLLCEVTNASNHPHQAVVVVVVVVRKSVVVARSARFSCAVCDLLGAENECSVRRGRGRKGSSEFEGIVRKTVVVRGEGGWYLQIPGYCPAVLAGRFADRVGKRERKDNEAYGATPTIKSIKLDNKASDDGQP
jgi:hypothetical protein